MSCDGAEEVWGNIKFLVGHCRKVELQKDPNGSGGVQLVTDFAFYSSNERGVRVVGDATLTMLKDNETQAINGAAEYVRNVNSIMGDEEW